MTTAAPTASTLPMSAAMPEDMLDLSSLERWRRAITALGRVMTNPEETDQVLLFVGYANAGTLAKRAKRFANDPVWEELYVAQRKIDSHTVDLDALAALPVGTLGHAYAHFLRSHGLTPEVFDLPPEGVRDPRIAYAIQRLRQSHDLWHVVTGHETDFAGEIALQAFTYAQLDAPASLILATVGSLRARTEYPGIGRDAFAAYRAGRRAANLATFVWEDHWTTPLAEVRARLNVQPVPRRAPVRAAA